MYPQRCCSCRFLTLNVCIERVEQASSLENPKTERKPTRARPLQPRSIMRRISHTWRMSRCCKSCASIRRSRRSFHEHLGEANGVVQRVSRTISRYTLWIISSRRGALLAHCFIACKSSCSYDRYPTFIDALRDIDDALCLVSLFAYLPSNKQLPPSLIENCSRLTAEWQLYVMHTHSLRKIFLSIKGIYLQAEVMDQTVTWLVPYQFTQDVSGKGFAMFMAEANCRKKTLDSFRCRC